MTLVIHAQQAIINKTTDVIRNVLQHRNRIYIRIIIHIHVIHVRVCIHVIHVRVYIHVIHVRVYIHVQYMYVCAYI